MLQVANSIAQLPAATFSAPEVESATRLAASTVHGLLTALTHVELLQRLPRAAGERIQRYERKDHSFWDATTHLFSDARAASAAKSKTTPSRPKKTENR
ncbi:MAG TPA: hypothetical protein VGO31_12060 [Microbacteriaceae bacterium]|nr:hypothetical protein [Microbacteriaceae bacterium]